MKSAGVIVIGIVLAGCGIEVRTLKNPVGAGAGSRKALAIAATDYQGTGKLYFLDLASGELQRGALDIHSDAIVRDFPQAQELVVVNRQGAESLQSIGYPTTETRFQKKLDTVSELQDFVLLYGQVGYVSMLAGTRVGKVTLGESRVESTIDLGTLVDNEGVKVVDDDGSAEATRFWVNGNEVWLLTQRLNRNTPVFEPTDRSHAIVINGTDDSIQKVIKLGHTNPVSDIKLGPDGQAYIGQAGKAGAISEKDGGIERIDPRTKVSAGMVVTEAALGGDIVDFEIIRVDLGVAIVAKPNTVVVSFDPLTGKVGEKELLSSPEYSFNQVLFEPERKLIYVADGYSKRSSVQVLDANSLTPRVDLSFDLSLKPYQMTWVTR